MQRKVEFFRDRFDESRIEQDEGTPTATGSRITAGEAAARSQELVERRKHERRREAAWARAARQIERSRSWRVGSFLIRVFRLLTFRRPASPQGPAELAASIEGHIDSTETQRDLAEERKRQRQWAREARNVERSRSWRVGSFLIRIFRLLTFRRPASPQGPAELAARIEQHIASVQAWLSKDLLQAIKVDALAQIDDRTFYVRGRARDTQPPITRVTAVSPEKGRTSLLEHIHRLQRPDVGETHKAPHEREAKVGFLACFETPLASRLEDGWALEVENAAGAVAEIRAPAVTVDPEDARAIAVADLDGEPGPESPLMDHVGPVVSTLQRRLANSVNVERVEEYGRVPKRPVASLLITIYRRTDLLEHQLVQFAKDHSLREAELIYVLDSPALAAETFRHAAELYELYRVPIRVVALSRHAGFAAAVNVGARLARAPHLLIMHSDVLPVDRGWLPPMLASYASVDGVGALGPKLLYEDETLQHAGVVFRRSHEGGAGLWDKVHRFKGLQRNLPAACEPGPVPAVADACLMIDRALFHELGGFSVDYWPGGYEDTDLCLRLREIGREVWYEPAVELYHLEGRSHAPRARGATGSRYSSWLHTRRWGSRLEEQPAEATKFQGGARGGVGGRRAVRSSDAMRARANDSGGAAPQLEVVGLTERKISPEILHGKHLAVPESADTQSARRFRIVGWVLPVAGPARAVEILSGDRLVARAELGLERPDVADAFSDVSHAGKAGFEVSLNLLALHDEAEVSFRAVIDGPRNLGLGSIRVRRHHARDEPHRVSVVIPCYEQAHFLAEAIESALSQTHAEVEVVVVNDGSRDNTSEVAARYPGVVLVEQPNEGLAAARNVGLRNASGDLLIFLDADDRLLDHAVEVGLAELEGRPDVVCTVGASRDIGVDGRALPGNKPPVVAQDHYERLLTECVIWCPSSVLYRRQAVEQVGGFNPDRRPDVNSSADYELYLNLARQFPLVFHNAVVTEYRRHGSSMNKNPALILKSELSVLRAQRQHLRNDREWLAWRRGLRRLRELHGSKLLTEVRELNRAGHTRLALRRLTTAVTMLGQLRIVDSSLRGRR